jgi:hypothetical protein
MGERPGRVRNGDVLAVLAAVKGEVALALAEPRRRSTGRLVRLRLLLLATRHTDVPLADTLAALRAALRERPCRWREIHTWSVGRRAPRPTDQDGSGYFMIRLM